MNLLSKANCLVISALLLFTSLYGDVGPYISERENLLLQECNQHFSAGEILNTKEEIVNEYLKSLQKKEKERYSSRELMLQMLKKNHDAFSTPLMSFIHRMPKGGVLHIHSSAMGDLHWILSRAMNDANCYVYLGEDNGKWVKGSFYMFDKAPSQDWKSVKSLREQSKDKDLFDEHMYRMVTLGAADIKEGVDVWDRFEKCFKRIKGLVRYTPYRKEFLTRSFKDFAKQNVQYIEVRSSVSRLYDLDGKQYGDKEYLDLYNAAIDEVRQEFPEFNVKVIHAAHRQATRTEMKEFLSRFCKMRALYPQLMVGFDIVNQEDGARSQYFYLNELLQFKQASDNIAYFFHAGETTERDNHNLLDSILLGTKRIGHGLAMAHHPQLMDLAKQKGIAVEVCPISNQVLGYVGDLKNHPARVLMNYGVPVVLSPDDPGVMGYPFTYDFYEASVYWDLDLKDLKRLSRNSLEYSAMEGQEKEKALKVWEEKWERFISKALIEVRKQAA